MSNNIPRAASELSQEEETVAAEVWSVDPRTGERRESVGHEATAADVDAAVRAAEAARPALADRETRIALLRAAAEELEAAGEEIIATADAETALGTARLTGELGRTTGQLRAFADEIAEGGYLDLTIDHADPSATPPRPDLRRTRVPLGVVAVYAASNFPLAFSVPGGDTASALAAGCPVVVKAHPDHPAVSELCAAAVRRAAERVGLAELADGVLSVVHGFDAGVELIRHPLVAAAGFTGSIRGGRALFDAAGSRPVPIPFHGELGSLNPVVVTAAAAEERADAIGAGLAGSMTMGVGQFCTKPGLVFVPEGPAGDALLKTLAERVGEAPAGVLLDGRMREAFLEGVRERAALEDVTAPVTPAEGDGRTVAAGFLTVPAARLADPAHGALLEECFGPVTVIARYEAGNGDGEPTEVTGALERLGGNLTASLHIGAAEAEDPTGPAARLLAALTPLAGRVLVNGWPTGVAVVPAQHHGGPYPAATSHSTSVGVAAVDRWLRPVAYQDTPPALLPPELRDENPLGLPRRVNGRRELG
ncbi:aldehyde dehydrogenase (NADP(+)) [Streptomyces sp. ST2-7A]|uniref:aldehyde dehydrogenase (NADP(+)) n=1 Tax=Streptomyces sp. ST2-7A TaxID=2907214 RepID=UPI001F29B055|nr:aldehyde dehydrogenase (NADP(+)) [Streptomyces sp. ST2-7A]MCE7082202.1 aldehyde dehydrogenase (NADP(+)) [Streptomyces sp. ST2-7A]